MRATQTIWDRQLALYDLPKTLGDGKPTQLSQVSIDISYVGGASIFQACVLDDYLIPCILAALNLGNQINGPKIREIHDRLSDYAEGETAYPEGAAIRKDLADLLEELRPLHAYLDQLAGKGE